METELSEGYIDLYEKLPERKKGIGYLREGVVNGKQIIIPALYDNYVFEVDIDNLQYSKKVFLKKGKGFSTIYRIDKWIWLFPFDEGEIIQWNSEDDTIIRHNIEKLVVLKKDSRNFLSAQKINNKLWIIPRFGNKVLSYDLVTRQLSNKNAFNSYYKNTGKELVGIAAEKVGQDILVLTERTDEIISFDSVKDEIKLINNEMPNPDWMEFMRNKVGKVVVSEKDVPLADYLDYICRRTSK